MNSASFKKIDKKSIFKIYHIFLEPKHILNNLA